MSMRNTYSNNIVLKDVRRGALAYADEACYNKAKPNYAWDGEEEA